MKYNYILTFWSGDILDEKDNVRLFLSSVKHLNDPMIKVILILVGPNNVNEVREEFKAYFNFLQCYFLGDCIYEYKITSYSNVSIFLERYASFYKAINELNILIESNTNMICILDVTDSYCFKNIFTCTEWNHKINLFADICCFEHSISFNSIHPIMLLWLNSVNKYLKTPHNFIPSDYIINGGTMFFNSLEGFKNFFYDINEMLLMLYKVINKEDVIDQAILNIYYYNNLFKRCNCSDFYIHDCTNNHIVGGYDINKFKLTYNDSKLIVNSAISNKEFSPAIYHCHFFNYPKTILNELLGKD